MTNNNTTQGNTMINLNPLTDAELFDMFNVDCGNNVDLLNVTFPREDAINRDAEDKADLQRERKAEQKDRSARMAVLAANLDQMEADDVSLTELLEKPKHI